MSKQDLLYVSDDNGEVTVYRYWQHTLVGALASLTQPMGECVDSASNVYITDYPAKKIFEFAHGGTRPIKQLDDSPDSPYACSVDTITGNLAVANDDGASKQGNIAIWSKGSGTPKIYGDSKLYNFKACAYDSAGNLLTTNGGNYSPPASFAWLPKGGTQLSDIHVPGPNPSWTWGAVDGVEWDGKYFGISFDYSLYRVIVTHGQAYYVGMTSFTSSGIRGPFWFYNNKPGSQATELVGGFSGSGGSNVYYWSYPGGGSPLYTLTHGVYKPVGVAISLRTL
ncbi:MAG TPA: hypothetical protein VIW73_04745 [Candidatus Cybelea sp.]